MDDQNDKKVPRKPPRDSIFLLAMLFYLLLVHGGSLLMSPAGWVQGDPQQYPTTAPGIGAVFDGIAGGSALRCALVTLPLLYASMVCVFLLTRLIAGGPPWLGSLAGSFLMAHPAKSEILYSATGIFYCTAALLSLLALLFYAKLRMQGGVKSLVLAYLFFVLATFPFVVNTALLGVILLIEIMLGTAERRNWLRPIPLVLAALAANWFHLDTVYAVMPTPDRMFAPLLLIVYPIGLLPETMADFAVAPWLGWMWGGIAALFVLTLLIFVKSTSFRFALLAMLLFRLYHGALPIDLMTMDGGGQLMVPIALAGIAFGAFSGWLLQFKEWGQPTVALTTVICVILFVLQFGADIAHVNQMRRIAVPNSGVESAVLLSPSTLSSGESV